MYDFYAVARKTERQAHNSRVGFGSEITEPRKVQCPKSWGIVTGSAGPFATFRFFPHRTQSEGFFAAVARKSADALDLVLTPRSRKSLFAVTELSRWVQERGMTLEGAKRAMKRNRRGSGLSRDAELLERLQKIRAELAEVRDGLKFGTGDEDAAQDSAVQDSAA